MVEKSTTTSPISLLSPEEDSVLSLVEEDSKKLISSSSSGRQLQYSLIRHSSPILEEVLYSVNVTLGSPLPKKWNENKLHPTYEVTIFYSPFFLVLMVLLYQTTIIIENCNKTHKILHFFHTYRELYLNLQSMGVGEKLFYPINCEFPPTYIWSSLGFSMPPGKIEERYILCLNLSFFSQFSIQVFNAEPLDAGFVQKVSQISYSSTGTVGNHTIVFG